MTRFLDPSCHRALALGWWVLAMGVTFLLWLGSLEVEKLSLIPGDHQWFTIAHQIDNTYHLWKLNPIETVLASLLVPSLTSSLVLSFGILALLGSNLPGVFLSGATMLLLFSMFQRDAVLLSSLSGIPWLMFALRRYRFAMPFARVTLTLAWVYIALSAHWSAPLILIITYLGFTSPSFPSPALIVFGVILLLISLNRHPDIPFPDYPPLAHVVPDDGVPGITRPLLGPDLPLPVVDQSSIRQTLGPWSVLLSLISFLLASRIRNRSSTIALICFVLVSLDCFLPPVWAEILPVKSLPRMVPGLSLLCVPRFILGSGLLLLFFLFHSLIRKGAWKWSFLPLGLSLIAIVVPSQPLPKLPSGFDLALPHKKLSVDKLLASPSARLVHREGLDRVLKSQSKDDFRRTDMIAATFSSSASPESLKYLVDRDTKTRWSPATGHQTGSEYLVACFNEPVPSVGVILSTGDFRADFPRGLRFSCVTGGKDWNEVSSNKVGVVLKLPQWLGPIEFTEKGYPYYGAQSDVTVIFPKTESCRCLRVEQIGTEENFDWSVAEFRVLRGKE